MTHANPRLPQLVFGDSTVEVEADVARYAQRIAKVVTSLQYYDAIGDARDFRSKSCTVTLGDMRLVAGANTPVAVSVDENADLTLMVPFAGANLSTVGKRTHRWHAGQAAMLFPKMPRGGQGGLRSNLNIDVNPRRLQATARAMLGLGDDQDVELGVDHDRLVGLRHGALDFAAMLRQHCRIIDAMLDQPVALSRLGMDDVLYRTIVMMLRPELFIGEPRSPDPGQRRLAELCEYIAAHLDEVLSLTRLEQFSGVSRRTLQLMFRRRYRCSPLQWINEQRLLAARDRLEACEPGATVTSVASAWFTNLGDFARQYRLQFGELPSQTLRRAQGRRP